MSQHDRVIGNWIAIASLAFTCFVIGALIGSWRCEVRHFRGPHITRVSG